MTGSNDSSPLAPDASIGPASPGEQSNSHNKRQQPRRKWSRLGWWKQYLPEPKRRAEVLVLGLIGIAVTWYVHTREHILTEKNVEILRSQIELQILMKQLIEIKSEAGVTSALLPYLSCSSDNGNIKFAITVMQENAPIQWKRISDQFPLDCASLRKRNIDPDDLHKRAEAASITAKFLEKVEDGKLYYDAGLWEAAARSWSTARDLTVPKDYTDKIVDQGALTDAQYQYYHNNYLEAAVMFKKAFQRILAR